MAWVSPSKSAEYRYTAGDEFSCPKFSTAWGRVSGASKDNCRVFEEISPPLANHSVDHVLVYSAPKIAVDSDVPKLSSQSLSWDALTRAVPGFSVPMLRIAELLFKTDWYITEKLNDTLLSEGMGPVNHVFEAISRATHKYTPLAERDALNDALEQVFKPFVSDTIQSASTMKQWFMCVSWMKKRNSIGHPLGGAANRIDSATLADFRLDVETNVDYDKVRDTTLVMLNLAEAMLLDGTAT